MRKLNKQQKIILLVSSIIVILVILVVSWLFYQYKTITAPGSSHNQTDYTSTTIPSLSGQGHVPGDKYKQQDTNQNGKIDPDEKEQAGGTDNNGQRASDDPVYSSPSSGSSGSYSHQIDDRCFSTYYDHLSQQKQQAQQNDMNNVTAQTTAKITQLLKDIEAAKPAINAQAHKVGGDYERISNTKHQNAKKPTKPYNPQAVRSYASAWSDSDFHDENGQLIYRGHDFNTQASRIYSSDSNQKVIIAKRYGSYSC